MLFDMDDGRSASRMFSLSIAFPPFHIIKKWGVLNENQINEIAVYDSDRFWRCVGGF